MRLVVGLGNPGSRYRDTWHNLGASVIEILALRWGVGFKPGKGEFIYADALRNKGKITLMIPTSFMNRSGGPVSAWMRYYDVEPSEILVIYDDHDLKLGQVRLRTQGSSGGHRGMDDIIRLTGIDEIARLKIGIRSETEHGDLAKQVLSKIPKVHQDRIGRILQSAADEVEELIDGDLITVMNRYNGLEIE